MKRSRMTKRSKSQPPDFKGGFFNEDGSPRQPGQAKVRQAVPPEAKRQPKSNRQPHHRNRESWRETESRTEDGEEGDQQGSSRTLRDGRRGSA
jgi:hypothetical protein